MTGISQLFHPRFSESSADSGRFGFEPVFALAGIVVFSFLVRARTFLTASFDWDEGIYVLMGASLLEGYLPYTEFWDVKPPLIYVTYALGLLPFDHSMAGIRILAVLAVAASGFVIYYFLRRICDCGILAAFASGVLYAVFTSADVGAAANTELFIAPLTVGALFLLLSENRSPREAADLRVFPWRIVLAGFLAALAIQFKYTALFDFLFFLLVLGVRVSFERHDFPAGENIRAPRSVALPNREPSLRNANGFREILITIAGPILVIIAPMALLFAVDGGILTVLAAGLVTTLAFAAGLIWLTREDDRYGALLRFLRFCCLFGLPSACVFLGILSLYHFCGLGELWFDANVFANMSNTQWKLEPHVMQFRLKTFFERTFPLLLVFAAVPWLLWFERNEKCGVAIRCVWTYFGFICLAVFATKRFYDHYFLLLLPVLCLCAGYFVDRLARLLREFSSTLAGPSGDSEAPDMRSEVGVRKSKYENVFAKTVKLFSKGYGLLAIAALFWGAVIADPALPGRLLDARELARGEALRDGASAVSRWLREHGASGKTIYVLDANPVIYYLADSKPPTRYAFPPFLIERFFVGVAGVDREAEVKRILRDQPEFIVKLTRPLSWLSHEDHLFLEQVGKLIAEGYVVVDTKGELEILGKKPQRADGTGSDVVQEMAPPGLL